MIFLLLASVSASSYDTLYETDLNVEPLNCSDFEEFCQRCNSTSIYKLTSLQSFQISGFLESTISLVETIAQDISQYVPSEDWYLSLTSEEYCFLSEDFTGDILFPSMFSDLLSLEYSSYTLPELGLNEEVYNIQFKALQGAGTSYYIEEINVEYFIDSEVYFANTIILDGTHKKIKANAKEAYIAYFGNVRTSDEEINTYYVVSFEYGEIPGGVVFELQTRDLMIFGPWIEATYESAGCENVPSPRGIGSILDLSVKNAYIHAEVTETELILSKFVSVLSMPDFAIGPEVLIENIHAEIQVQDAICEIKIQGFWENLKTFSILLVASENTDYKISASLKDLPKTMTLLDYQNIYSSFYPDPTPIFPVYDFSSQLVQDLENMVLYNPIIYLEFQPEAIVKISSLAEISKYNDTQVDLETKRNNTIIQTIGSINTISIGELFDIGELYAEEVHLGNCVMSISQESILFNVEIFTACNTSEICNLVENALTSEVLEGKYYPIDFYIRQLILDTDVDGLLLYDNEFRVYMDNGQIMILGNFDVMVADDYFLSFNANFSSFQGSAYFISEIIDTWEHVLDIDALYVPYLLYTGSLNYTQFMRNKAQGTCSFISILNSWDGIFSLSLNYTDYTGSNYTCQLDPAENTIVFKFLADMQVLDELASSFEFPYGLHLTLNTSYFISGIGYFLSIPMSFISVTPYIPNALVLTLTPYNFYTGFYNIYASNLLGTIEVSSSYSKGEVLGDFDIWGIKTSGTIFIEENHMDLQITGYIFAGSYKVDIYLTSNVTDFTDCIWNVTFSIGTDDIIKISEEVRTNVEHWVLVGVSTLNDSENALEEAQDLVDKYSQNLCSESCPMIETCTTPLTLQCTEKAIYYECVEYLPVCEITIQCTSLQVICIDEACTKTAELCLEYEDLCETGEDLDCQSIELKEIGVECLGYEMVCNEEFLLEESCVQECEFLQDEYEMSLIEYDMIYQAYLETLEEMSGFIELSSSMLCEIIDVKTEFQINQVGISQKDIMFVVDLKYYSNGEFLQVSLPIMWNFKLTPINVSMLTGIVIQLIVKDEENLTDDLLTKTPREVYYENFNLDKI
ncbi:hypothetical protein SteCoe_2832 [Stentor coeruleus]|uniref:Uncharacterized protein n=1 Tax=Stentor coeruleus TaxID=5963 RepID=A0A1R2CYI1_9CILI|nr:hypothetical protein SteCoe_2832 [Stentor coeruleus]